MRLEVIFLRAYALPPAISADEYGAYSEELFNQLEAEAKDYLTEKIKEGRARRLEKYHFGSWSAQRK